MEEFQMWELGEGELGGILSSFSNNNKSINLTWIFEREESILIRMNTMYSAKKEIIPQRVNIPNN